jgi:hypothetical protein
MTGIIQRILIIIMMYISLSLYIYMSIYLYILASNIPTPRHLPHPTPVWGGVGGDI